MPNLRSTVLPVSLFLAFALNLSEVKANTSALNALQFQRPTRTAGTGAPGDRSDGGSRGDCLAAGAALNALVPMEQENEEIAPDIIVPGQTHVWGNTTSSTPTLWFALPQPIANGTLELQLLSADGQELETISSQLPSTAGILPIQLSKALATGNRYRWTMRIEVACPNNEFQALTVNGWINRVETPTEIADNVAKASLEEKAILYAQAGLWHDALTMLMDLHQAYPEDLNVTSALNSFLAQIELDVSGLSPISFQY